MRRRLRILVTGTNGQLARALLERAPLRGVEIIAVGRPQIDLAGCEDLSPVFAAVGPDVVVNAAAYTAVDQAESEPELAEAVNARGAGVVAQAAAELRIPIIQVSTDYVFDGRSANPYREEDPVAPLGVYGRTKLAGERAVAARSPNHAILRTAWVYSPFGKNFVHTMLRLAETHGEVGVVADQRGCPNNGLDLADGVITVAMNLIEQPSRADLRGIFHLTADGEASWAEFAAEIFAVSARLGGPHARVRPIGTSDYPTAARRPSFSCLDRHKLARHHGVHLGPWRASLEPTIRRLLDAVSGGSPS